MVDVLNNLDLHKNQILNVAIQNLATAPSSPVLGQIYYNTADNILYICTDAATPTWQDVGSGLSGAEIVTLINASSSVIDVDNLAASVGTAVTNSHTHSNKATLDTYTQTEANLADAVSKKHSHANSADLALVSGTNTGDETQATIKTKLGAATTSVDGYLSAADMTTIMAGIVTNGDSHNHSGGDGAQIAYSSLSGTPTLGTAAAKTVGAASGNIQENGAALVASRTVETDASSKFITVAKATGYNLALGTTAGTVAEGNHTHSTYATKQSITAATKCKITYNAEGVITAGADLAASDLPLVTVAKGGTGLSTIAAGGILYASALDTLSRIAPSAANQVLRSSGANAAAFGALIAADIPTLTLAKISDAGTAAACNTGTSSGNVPILDANGQLSTSVLPAITINEVFTAATQAAMLALTAQRGDMCIRSDEVKTYVLATDDPTTLANWKVISQPDSVTSVAGKTGIVTLAASDVGLGNVTNESKATMFTSAALTGTPTAPTAAKTVNTTQIATTAHVKSVVADYAPLASPALTGTPTAPTAAAATDTTQVATTAFVHDVVDTVIQAKRYSADVGDGTNASIAITHNLGTTDVVAMLRDKSTGQVVLTDMVVTSANVLTIVFATAPAAAAYRVTIIG